MNMQSVAAVEERGGISGHVSPSCIIHNLFLRLYQYLDIRGRTTDPFRRPVDGGLGD